MNHDYIKSFFNTLYVDTSNFFTTISKTTKTFKSNCKQFFYRPSRSQPYSDICPLDINPDDMLEPLLIQIDPK